MDQKVNYSELIKECKKLFRDDSNIEQILTFLREKTCRKAVSIKLLSDLLNISINEARRIVHNSDTWADVKESDENLEQAFVNALKKLENE